MPLSDIEEISGSFVQFGILSIKYFIKIDSLSSFLSLVTIY